MERPFISFLQETYNYDGNPCGLTKSYLHFLPNCNSRALIYAPPELGLTFHAHLSSRDCTTCSIKVEGDTIFFSSVYLDIRLTVEEPVCLLNLSKISSSCVHLLAGLDTNSHSDAWGSNTLNSRGSLVEEILFQHNLCLLNEGNDPTFETSCAATCIDITVASPALASLITKWKVQTEMQLSDHHLITAQLDMIPDMMPLRSGRHLKKADWKTFSSLITTTYARYEKPLLWTTSTIDKATAFLHSAIEAALDEVAAVKPYRPK
jgi:hypothetical protein